MITGIPTDGLFVWFFDSMQAHTNFISNITRRRLAADDIEQGMGEI
ncbi:hypothetical protein IMCC9480_3449 [Oxalobacteraceae bacterium IMCC9480]|nr:hypothetical protein IMCC9480_3449 [Oxalobacteraceae bacterium IMCC9480]